VFEGAVSDRPGDAYFDFGPQPEMGHLSAIGDVKVTTFTLDMLLGQGQIKAPQLLKIDVEGAEMDVLHGASKLIEFHRPTILLATHSIELHNSACGFLTSRGYDLKILEDPTISGGIQVGLGELLASPQIQALGQPLSQ
jgi:hypothetical protein